MFRFKQKTAKYDDASNSPQTMQLIVQHFHSANAKTNYFDFHSIWNLTIAIFPITLDIWKAGTFFQWIVSSAYQFLQKNCLCSEVFWNFYYRSDCEKWKYWNS